MSKLISFSVTFSVFFLKEVILPLQIVGAAFIIGGAVFGDVIKWISHGEIFGSKLCEVLESILKDQGILNTCIAYPETEDKLLTRDWGISRVWL